VVFVDKLNGLPAIGSLGHYLEIGLLFEQEAQTGPNNGVIVGEDDADLWHAQVPGYLPTASSE